MWCKRCVCCVKVSCNYNKKKKLDLRKESLNIFDIFDIFDILFG